MIKPVLCTNDHLHFCQAVLRVSARCNEDGAPCTGLGGSSAGDRAIQNLPALLQLFEGLVEALAESEEEEEAPADGRTACKSASSIPDALAFSLLPVILLPRFRRVASLCLLESMSPKHALLLDPPSAESAQSAKAP